MIKELMSFPVVFLGICGFFQPAGAALNSVSGFPDPVVDEVTVGGPKENVAYSLANGFPLWYRDLNSGLKLELCLDQEVETAAGPFFPCLTEEPFAGAPISFPSNFGTEAFWWMASAAGTFISTPDATGTPRGGDALLVLALEAAFSQDLGAVDGDQVAFSRIRIRINVPVNGTYRVTHPYGSRDYVVTNSPLTEREIDQTQDLGSFLTPGPPPLGDFTLALADGPSPPGPPAPTPPSLNDAVFGNGIVNAEGAGLGPFLVAADAPGGTELPFVVALDGRRYLADPGFGEIHLEQPVTGGLNGNNTFRIELLDPPEAFFLNAEGNGGQGSQIVEFTHFQLSGKLFNDGANTPPVAHPDYAATSVNIPTVIDVLANDLDPVGAGNAHGINPQALGLPTDPLDLTEEIFLTKPLTTAAGGTVQRQTSFSTGRAAFRYIPPAGFTGIDNFDYVVQDTGGRLSSPTTVTVIVEGLTAGRAEYWAKTGKWRIEGESTDPTDNIVTLTAGPRARLAGDAEIPAVDTDAAGVALLRLTSDAIEFRVSVDSLTAIAVTVAKIHIGSTEENGPAIFLLYDEVAHGAFTGSRAGILTRHQLLAQPALGIRTFADALEAILAGNTYVNLETRAYPGGEIRGQLVLPVIGTAPVDAGGEWRLSGKSKISPGGVPASVNALSANGIRLLGIPLRMR